MLKKVLSASILVLFGSAMGCNESSPASNAETTEQPTRITANRPVTTDLPTTKAESEERTNAGVTLYDRDRKVKAPIDQPEKVTVPKKSPPASASGSSK